MPDQNLSSSALGIHAPGPLDSLLASTLTPEIYAKNSFRVLGVPVLATARAIATQVQKLQVLAELGDHDQLVTGAFPVRPAATLDDIRKAQRQLDDPVQRILQELFWFWPLDRADGTGDPAWTALYAGDATTARKLWVEATKDPQIEPIASHNLAVLSHMLVLAKERRSDLNTADSETLEKDVRAWKATLKLWAATLTNDATWETLSARVIHIDDPRLTLEIVQELRRATGPALLAINCQLAMQAVSQGNFRAALRQISRIVQANFKGLNAPKVAAELSSQLRGALRAHLETTDRGVEDDPKSGAAIARKLIAPFDGFYECFDLLEKISHDDSYLGTFDEVVRRANQHAVAYSNTTGDFAGLIALMEELKPWVYGEELADLLARNASTGESNLQQAKIQPFIDLLDGIDESRDHPTVLLDRLNAQVLSKIERVGSDSQQNSDTTQLLHDRIALSLIGLSVRFWNDHQDGTKAREALELASKYALSEEAKAAVSKNLIEVQGLAAAHSRAKWGTRLRWGFVAALIGVPIIWSIIEDSSSSSQYTPPTTSPSFSKDLASEPETALVPDFTDSGAMPESEASGRPIETAPPVGRNRVLGYSQLRYCVAEKIRVDAAEQIVDQYSEYEVDRFNQIVADYNSRCGEFKYREGSLQSVERSMKPYRSQIEAEGRRKLRPNSETGATRLEPKGDPTVLAVQHRLNNLGYDVGTPDGVTGLRTVAAIQAFQQSRGMKPDGIPTEALLFQLSAAPLQSAADGKYPKTEAASGRSAADQAAAVMEANASPAVQMARLGEQDRRSIESACSTDRLLNGQSAYSRCLRTQMGALEVQGGRPDLSATTAAERGSMESACSTDRLLNGAAAYNECLTTQLRSLNAQGGRPNLSSLSPPELASAESACSSERLLNGPATYHQCLSLQLRALNQLSFRPDLSELSLAAKQSVENACSTDRLLNGPAAYYTCLTRQIAQR